MSGYFDKEQHKQNRTRYPNLSALDEKVSALLSSSKRRGWDTARIEYEICRAHPVYWMEEYGHIRKAEVVGGSEEVGILPFKLNPVQLQIADKVCAAFVPHPWHRVQAIVLKHRKAGVSTLFAALDYWLMRFTRGFNMFVIADLGGHTDNIVAMIELFHEKDTCGAGSSVDTVCPPERIPMQKNKKGFRLSNGSMLEQDSGENANPGTSGTIQGCHMSENAKWRVAEKSEVSLLNSIPRTGFAFVVKESTAYGINKFQQDWETAEKGQSNWTPIFISWRNMPDCEDPLLPGEDLTLTPREEELTTTYKLRSGHIKFRRRQIQALGSERAFQQDFPLNPREPFLSSGMPYFPVDKVQERLDELAFYEAWKTQDEKYLVDNFPEILLRLKHHPRGLREALGLLEDRAVLGTLYTLSLNQDVVTYTREAEARPESGAVTVFRLPDPSRQYLLSVDGGEGLRSRDYTSDLSVVEVVDTFRREQVAEWAGVFDEEVTSMYAVMLGRMYNMGQIVVEMNNRCGGILWEKMLAWKYPRLFYRQSVTSGSRIQKEPGWLTTVGNKAEVCGKLRLDFKNDDCLVYSRPLLEEMLFFTDDRGKLAAMPGHTDDRVMAMAMNLRVIADTPALRQPMRRETPEQMKQIFREYDGHTVMGRPRVYVSRRYR